MTATISVVSGASMVGRQQLVMARGGKMTRLGAVKGARYLLAEPNGSPASGDIAVERDGEDLVIVQRVADAEPVALVIEDFYSTGSELVGPGANGEIIPYVADIASGGIDVSTMADGASYRLSSAVEVVAVERGVQTGNGASFGVGGALASMAAVAAAFAQGGDKASGGVVQSPQAARSLAVAPEVLEAAASTIAPAVNDTSAVLADLPQADTGTLDHRASVEADQAAPDAAPATAESGPALPAAAPLQAAVANAAPAAAPRSVDDTPVIDAVIDDQGLIQGIVADGGYTDDGRPQIVGKAEAGVLVHVYRGVELIGQVYANAHGDWSFTPKLPFSDGRHAISIVHEYPDGDVSEFSQPYVIFVDKSVPDAPVITGIYDDEGRITGAISEGMVTDDNRPTIDGTAEAHAMVVVYDKGKEIGRTQVGADGKWSFTPEPALADGLHILSYAAMDRAGNGSERTAVSEFIVDTRPEKINIYYADDDIGSQTGEVFSGGATDDSMPTLFGTATAGGIVSIYEGSVLLGEVVADVDGTWQFTPSIPLAEGMHSFHATVTLVAKGESAPSKLFKLEVDVTAPSAPSIDAVLDDAGVIHGLVANGDSTDDATPTLSGSAEKGSTVSVFANGVLLGSAVVDAAGQWSFTPVAPLTEGDYAFTISATDAAGNSTASNTPYLVTIDLSRPDAPTIDSVYDDVGDSQGVLNNGARTDDTQPTFTGKAEANSTIVIRDVGVEIGRVQADAAGNWTFTPVTALGSGAHAITVVAVDAAGNASFPSDAFNLSVSLVAPVAPSIDSIYDDVGLGQGALKSGAVTDDDLPLISGKGEPNTLLLLTDNDVELARVLVDAAGNWSYLPTAPLSKGVHNLVVTEVDAQGAPGASSAVFGFRVVELGGAGGFENFNELNPQQKWGHEDLVVLSSGLTLSGNYYVRNSGGSTTADSNMHPNDRYNFIAGHDGGAIKFDLPSETAKASFFYITNGSGASVAYFDVAGNLIAEFSLKPVVGSASKRVSFEAPEGILIGSIVIKSPITSAGNDFIFVDCLQWGGERNPTGISISTAETDSTGARIVYGAIDGALQLPADMVVQVSTDGGITWTDAAFAEGSWAAIQMGMPAGNWTAEVRIAERSSGLSTGLTDSKYVETLRAAAPAIERIVDAEGMYTAAKAADGSLIEVSLENTGAKLGDRVHIRWGTVTYDQWLTKADIDAGHVTVRMPADQILQHGVTTDFLVTAQIIGKAGTISALSQPYQVIGTYTVSASISDTLQTAPVNNIYKGSGFAVTTEGVLAKTALTAATYAGLTLGSSESQANALFTLNKPARSFTLRLSGIDNEQGVKIQIFDAKGNLIEEQTIYGDSTAFHANTYSYSAKDERVDIGSFRIVANEANVTLDGFSRKDALHAADARLPNLIATTKDSFHGTDAADVVNLQVKSSLYMNGLVGGAGIHGGGGIDRLKLVNSSGSDTIYLNEGVSSMEIMELVVRSGSTKGLYLNVSDVLRNGSVDAFYSGDRSRVQMMVTSSSPDGTRGGILLSDELPGGLGMADNAWNAYGGDIGDWVYKSIVSIDGLGSFYSYQHSALDIEVLAAVSLTGVTLKNRKEFVEWDSDIVLSVTPATNEVLADTTNYYTAGDDDIIARSGYADRISGGAGNDAIRNVGIGDAVHAGSGDDVVSTTTADFAQINGGTGVDTLVVDGQSIHIDLAVPGQKLQGFEKFDLGGGGNTLSLRVEDLLAEGARDLMMADGKLQMLVKGSEGSVNLLGGIGDWADAGSMTLSGVSYSIYANHAGTAELLVQDMLQVTLV